MSEVRQRASNRRLGPTLSFMRALWDLNHALEVASSRMLRDFGVTGQQRFILRLTGKLGPLSAGRLAHMLHVHPGTLSAALTRLERRGLISRKRDRKDARSVLIHLTPRGKRLVLSLPVDLERSVAHAIRSEDRAAILQTLARLAKELRIRNT